MDVSEIEDGIDQLRAALVLTIIYLGLILFPVIAFMCISIKCRTHCSGYVMLGLILAVELLSVTIVALSYKAKGLFDGKAEVLTALDNAVEGCMDRYSDLSEVEIREQLIRPADEATKAASVLAAFGIVILVKIFLAICMGCIIRSKSRKAAA